MGWREIWDSSGKDAAWGLFLIVIILGGIYGGIFTPTEAAAVAAVYASFLIATFVYRDMGPLKEDGNNLILKNPLTVITSMVTHPDTKHTLLEPGN